MGEIVGASILFLVSIAAFIISILSFMEKGFLFNNAYLYADKQEREKMNKKPHYRQSAIVFLAFGLVFFLNGINVFFQTNWIFFITAAIVIITLIYAIISSVMIEKNNK